jgi:hypothetical protein
MRVPYNWVIALGMFSTGYAISFAVGMIIPTQYFFLTSQLAVAAMLTGIVSALIAAQQKAASKSVQ